MGIGRWKKQPLKELCTRVGDGLHGTPKYSDSSSIPFINGNNLKNGNIIVTESTNYVTQEEYDKNFIELNSFSLLLSINGTLGSMAFYNGEQIMLGKSAAYLNFKTEINKFQYYYFQLPSVQNYFYNVATGSTIKNLSLKSIQDFEVPVPDVKEYKQIAKVLSDLDAKIEVNNKINQELEAMAKLIYDYWFVQFDFPNSDGKPYKSSGGKMVYNAELKREIPIGWEVKPLVEELDVQYGYPFSTDYFNEEKSGKPVIRIRDILNNSVSIYSTEIPDCKYMLEKGDLLIGMDGNFHMNFWDKNECYLNQRSVRIRKRAESVPSLFQVLFGIRPYIQAREKNVSRTTVGHLSARDINGLKVLIPSVRSLIEKTNIFDSMLNKLISGRNENQKLSELRDWLLPMLMNGQVRVGYSNENGNLGEAEERLGMVAEERGTYGK